MEYYYISTANKAEGPVSLEQLQSLLANGTISPATKIAPVGAQEWSPLSTAIPSAAAPTPPPPPTGTPPPLANTFPAHTQSTPVTDPLAIVALVLSLASYALLCFGFPLSIAAVICAHISRNRSQNCIERDGNGMALAALWIGYIYIALSLLLFMGSCLQGMASAALHHPL